VWLSADGRAVLDHDGFVGGRLRRKPISQVPSTELPPHVPLLSDLYATCGIDFELSLDIKDPAAIAEVLLVSRDAGAESRLWVCHHDWELVASWRDLSSTARLVDSTRLGRIKEGPERRAATLQSVGIDAVNLHHSDWSGGLIALFHRFERFALGWDAQFDRTLDALLDAGIDGVFSDHTDLMVGSIAKYFG
jgi:glycerophosphoryl diester phosphodiesterase